MVTKIMKKVSKQKKYAADRHLKKRTTLCTFEPEFKKDFFEVKSYLEKQWGVTNLKNIQVFNYIMKNIKDQIKIKKKL